jgi:hypothetical protein
MKKRRNTAKAKPPHLMAEPARKIKRKLGAYGDKIKIADDFDAPLPEEMLRAFEGYSELVDKPRAKK